jgi:hypothetical protein
MGYLLALYLGRPHGVLAACIWLGWLWESQMHKQTSRSISIDSTQLNFNPNNADDDDDKATKAAP